MAGSVSKQVALDRLAACVRQMPGLEQAGHESAQFARWRKDAAAAVRHIFADDPTRVKQFEWELSVIHLPKMGSNTPQAEAFSQGLADVQTTLESMLSEVEHYWADEECLDASDSAPKATPASARKKVFIVHGHDDGLKETVARFLSQLRLEPTILHEKPDEGNTIIEKFEKHSDVSYAVILLTGDDEGRRRGSDEELKPRARQNVVFELGYFAGRLGRQGVSVLYEEGVDIPSDYSGVVYIPLDGSWKSRLIRELKAAGMELDAQAALDALS